MSVASNQTANVETISDRVERDCPSCQSTDRRALPRYRHPDWETVKCNACGFVYLSQAPHYEALAVDLGWTQQFVKEKERRATERPVFNKVDQATRWRLRMRKRPNHWEYITQKVASGRVLDVGCGSFNHVPEIYEPYGIDIEKVAIERANPLMQERGGFAVCAPALEGLISFQDDFLDGIIMRSYLEHETKPREVLEAAHAKLKQGGVIYVKVPNYGTLNRMVMGVKWCGFRFPDHLNYFTIPSLRTLAEKTGYKFEQMRKLTSSVNDNMHCFLTKV